MENMPKLKVGVIGTGALGRHHSRLYAQSPNAEMVGIFDVQKPSAVKVAEEFGLKVFDTLEELAASCDALSVAVPANYHAETVVKLLEMGKHVLVEKPISSSVADGERMCKAAEKANAVLGVGHVERFNPAMDIIEKYSVEPVFIEARRLAAYPPSRPGLPPRGTEVSVVLDLMIHDIDLVLAMIDSEVEKIDVIGSPVLSPEEDIVNARIKFANGSCAQLTASRLSPVPERSVKIFGKKGCLSMDFGGHGGTFFSKDGNAIVKEELVPAEKNALAAELEDFISAVQLTRATGKLHNTRISGEEGLKALKLAAAIEEASRSYNKKYGFEL